MSFDEEAYVKAGYLKYELGKGSKDCASPFLHAPHGGLAD
jgi:hypothetical protein